MNDFQGSLNHVIPAQKSSVSCLSSWETHLLFVAGGITFVGQVVVPSVTCERFVLLWLQARTYPIVVGLRFSSSLIR